MRTRTLILLGILLLAAFLRLFLLSDTPPGLYPDEAMNGLDALRTLQRSDFRIFYPDNNGREGLFIGIQAIAIQVFGASAWTLRFVSAAAGILTLPFFFLLAREIGLRFFGNGKADGIGPVDAFALLATFLLAVSFWHINFSRIGFRAILLPLFSAMAFAFLFRGLRLHRTSDYAAAGAALALSLYSYIASRIVPALLLFPILIDIEHRRISRAVVLQWLALTLAFLFVLAPFLGYFATHPEDFFGRAGDVSVLSAENPARALLANTGKTLLMFHVRGDGNWRHNVAHAPLLDAVTGTLFLIGLGVAIGRLAFGKRGRMTYLFLLAWFVLLLLPAIMTNEGVPHALRTFAVLPAVILLAALGGMWLFAWVRQWLPKAVRYGTASMLIVFLLLSNAHRYFLVWAGHPDVQGAFRTDLVVMAEKLNSEPESARFVIVNEDGVLLDVEDELDTGGVPMPAATIKFLTLDNPDIVYARPDTLSRIVPEFDNTLILTTKPATDDLIASLKALFPSLSRVEEDGLVFFRL